VVAAGGACAMGGLRAGMGRVAGGPCKRSSGRVTIRCHQRHYALPELARSWPASQAERTFDGGPVGAVEARMSKDEEFEEFFRRTAPRVFARARFLCRNWEKAHDAAVRAYHEAYRSWEKLDSPDRAIWRILERQFFKVYKESSWGKLKVVLSDLLSINGGPVEEAPSPEELLIEDEEVRNVMAAIDMLPDRQREAIVLVCLEELSCKEAAEVMGISVNTVYATLRKAKSALARMLGLDERKPPRTGDGDSFLPDMSLQDPVGVALCDAEEWLIRRLSGDAVVLDQLWGRVRAAIDQGVGTE
jgi:RNA polymerase sigma-70 factor, ECF subfamily